eukprot:8992004-Alexandrium_andersonii.AAC.1
MHRVGAAPSRLALEPRRPAGGTSGCRTEPDPSRTQGARSRPECGNTRVSRDTRAHGAGS